MIRLRISPIAAARPEYDGARIEAWLPDRQPLVVECELRFRFPAVELVDLAWYFETFLQFPEAPAPARARAVEQRLAERGAELFALVFAGSGEARALWQAVRARLPELSIEIVSAEGAGFAPHWEALRETPEAAPLALQVRRFVRIPQQVPLRPPLPRHQGAGQRVLLVIARPDGSKDVPYRIVAEELFEALRGSPVTVDLLRPPRYERLMEVVRHAAAAGRPYDVLHFDGHGRYGNAGPLPGARGHLLFEDIHAAEGAAWIDGRTLGGLMRENGIGTLVLNACRSGFLDGTAVRRAADDGVRRAVGSFAEEAVRAGAGRVVAMRYDLYAVTAARLMASLYRAVAAGHAVEDALSVARRDLAAHAERRVGTTTVALQDWVVPVLLAEPGAADEPAPDASTAPLPAAPRWGTVSEQALFVGRDETFYRLDRWLDVRPAVLLWGMAGRGKTGTAHAFARWYALTGGVQGAVVAHERTAREFALLPQDGAAMAELSHAAAQGGMILLDAKGTLTNEAVAALRLVVQSLVTIGGKVILSARQRTGLDDLLQPIFVPPLDETHAAELAERATGLPTQHLLRLLRFAAGHPHTICLVGAATFGDADRLDALLDRLETGTLRPDATDGTAAILTEARRLAPSAAAPDAGGLLQLMAVLHLARGYASLALLVSLWRAPAQTAMIELGGPDPAAANDLAGTLLEAMVQTGLAADLGYRRYALHPLTPLAVAPLFATCFPPGGAAERRVRLAWAGALQMGMSAMIDAYNRGDAGALSLDLWGPLAPAVAEAWAYCRKEGHTDVLASLLGARCMIAHETGDLAAMRAMLEECRDLYVDRDTGSALAGREGGWGIWTSNQIRYLRRVDDLPGAERLAACVASRERIRCADLLQASSAPLSPAQRAAVGNLARTEYQRAIIAARLGRPDAASVIDEAMTLAERAGNASLAGKIGVLRAQVANAPAVPEPDVEPVTAALQWSALGRAALAEAGHLLQTTDDMAAVKQEARSARLHLDRALAALPEHLHDTRAGLLLDRAHASLLLGETAASQDDAARAIRHADLAVPNGPLATAARALMSIVLRAGRQTDAAALYAATATTAYAAHGDEARRQAMLGHFDDRPDRPDPPAASDGAPA